MSKIFLSYRRSESSGYLIALYPPLEEKFGRENIFRDMDTTEPVTAIGETVSACDALLAVIGSHWVNILDAKGRCLDNPNDAVRREIAAALSCGIPVIPVLVSNASMPLVDELPDELKALAGQNALQMDDLQFAARPQKLIAEIERIIELSQPPRYADGFDVPVGTEEERRSEKIWPGAWVNASPYLNYQFNGYNPGAHLNPPRNEDKGKPCYSIASGKVVYAGRAVHRDGSPSAFGNLVVIRHDPYLTSDGEEIKAWSRYAHMKDILVESGQRVERGQQLATVWNNGTKMHLLYFDICTTGILEERPAHWPGRNKPQVEKHYVDPEAFIRQHRPKSGKTPEF